VVVRSIHRDVLIDVFGERVHKRLEIFLPTHFAEVLGREVRVHARAVPVERLVVAAEDRLAMQLDIHAVLLANARHDVAGDPHLIGCPLGSFAKDLVFPLALCDLGVDTLDVDAGRDADVDVLLDDLSRGATDILVANSGVVGTLWGGKPPGGSRAEHRPCTGNTPVQNRTRHPDRRGS